MKYSNFSQYLKIKMKKTTSLVFPSMPNEYYNKFVGEGMIGKCDGI